jgi:hypothetical protein
MRIFSITIRFLLRMGFEGRGGEQPDEWGREEYWCQSTAVINGANDDSCWNSTIFTGATSRCGCGNVSDSDSRGKQEHNHPEWFWGQWWTNNHATFTGGSHDWSKRSSRGQFKHKGGSSRWGAKIMERRCRRAEKRHIRPKFTILSRGVSQSSNWWRRKVRITKEGGQRQRATIWARAKS